tara:strand:+ start:7432 stop:8067 length:636 start_codon:yes stop_codon:yes gene_type:complete
MSNSISSQCHFVQLQIDSFIEGDLDTPQVEAFKNHIDACQACEQELLYAQTILGAVSELPLLDCPDHVLEPIHRLSGGSSATNLPSTQSLLSRLQQLFSDGPVFARYALPMVLVATLAILFTIAPRFQGNVPQLAEAPQEPAGAVEQYSPEEIYQALQDLNLAIEYLSDMSRRTEAMISDRFLITPLQESLDASFQSFGRNDDDSLNDDPI